MYRAAAHPIFTPRRGSTRSTSRASRASVDAPRIKRRRATRQSTVQRGLVAAWARLIVVDMRIDRTSAPTRTRERLTVLPHECLLKQPRVSISAHLWRRCSLGINGARGPARDGACARSCIVLQERRAGAAHDRATLRVRARRSQHAAVSGSGVASTGPHTEPGAVRSGIVDEEITQVKRHARRVQPRTWGITEEENKRAEGRGDG